eukprot:COSAG02_NODE_36663_length_452_cov_0.691218_1_plen_24_part_10
MRALAGSGNYNRLFLQKTHTGMRM